MATQSGAEAPSTAPHAVHDELNNEEGLQHILRELCVPAAMHQALRAQGICCIADFAYAYNSTADLDSFATSKDEEFWTALQVTEPLHSMPMARLRRALVQAQIRVKAYEMEMQRTEEPATQSFAPSSSTAPPADSWVEHAPQRLDNDTVAKLVADFKEAYPGELLDSASTPSIRLLSMVHAWFKDPAQPRIKYIPWQFRMSQRQYMEIIEAKAHRIVRTEAQLISTALFDDTPTFSIAEVNICESWLQAKQRIFSNAIALCQGAHLAVLKALDSKICEQCTQVWKPGHGLRNVSTEEMLDADRKLWRSIATLVEEQGFSLDEALHEMTHVRGDIGILMQARPRMPTAPHRTHHPHRLARQKAPEKARAKAASQTAPIGRNAP